MPARTFAKPIKTIYQQLKSYTGVSGNAHTNIYLTTTLPDDLGVNSTSAIVGCQAASDSGANGAVYTIFRNGNSVYLKSDMALSNATINVYWYIWQ